jgi:hypothetical protein
MEKMGNHMVRSGIYMGTHWEMAGLWMIYGLDILIFPSPR